MPDWTAQACAQPHTRASARSNFFTNGPSTPSQVEESASWQYRSALMPMSGSFMRNFFFAVWLTAAPGTRSIAPASTIRVASSAGGRCIFTMKPPTFVCQCVSAT